MLNGYENRNKWRLNNREQGRKMREGGGETMYAYLSHSARWGGGGGVPFLCLGGTAM